MRKVLFISPHLDDAVFSCATRILREAQAGAEVTVATVFSHARRGSPQWAGYVARREEDRRALKTLGAKPRWLGLVDAPCRIPFYNSFHRIVLETADTDLSYRAIVQERLTRAIDEFAPDEVYLPLAIGTHIDHRLVFSATAGLTATCPGWFYEDQPYALVHAAADLRLQEIHATAPAAARRGNEAVPFQNRAGMIARFLQSFRRAPYVRRHLPPGPERKAVESLLRIRYQAPTEVHLNLLGEIQEASRSDQPQILRALYSYRSQARAFLGPRQEFISACRRHASVLGVSSWRAERYWKPAVNEASTTAPPPLASPGKRPVSEAG